LANKNADDKLNYDEFTNLVFNTIDKVKQSARKQMKILIKEIEENKSPTKRINKERLTPESIERHSSLSNFSSSQLGPFDDDDEDDDELAFNTHRSRASARSLQSNTKQSSELSLRNIPPPDKMISNYARNRNLSSNSKGSNKSLINNSDTEEFTPETLNNKSIIQHEIKLKASNKCEPFNKEPNNLSKWNCQSIKGSFFVNKSKQFIQSNSFIIDIERDTNIYIEAEPYLTNLHLNNNDLRNMDVILILVKDEKINKLRAISIDKNKYVTIIIIFAFVFF
jgi:hypothetical protein